MAMARMAVSLPCNAAEDGQSTFWLGVIAFGKQADALAKHQKGDLVSVAGNMQVNYWMGQDGRTQQGQATNALRRAHEQHPPATVHKDFDQTPPFDDGF